MSTNKLPINDHSPLSFPNITSIIKTLINANRFRAQLLLMSLILLSTVIFALSEGRYPIEFHKVINILLSHVFDISSDWRPVEQRVVELVRLPRILVAGLCGAALSLSGAALQGMFRNPLVGPQIIGVSSGAAFGGVIAILLMLADYFIALFAFGFGMFALLITLAIARSGGGQNVLSLVLG